MAEWRTVERVILPRHGEAIRLAGLITGGRQAAEEAVQEAIVRAAVAGHDLRAPGSAWWWFRRIVVHEALRIARREARAVATDLADDLPDNAPLPGEALVAAEEGAAAWAALRTLSPVLRAAITLRHVAGLTVPETAAVLGVPPGTVKSRCAAARALLRIRIDRPLPEVVEMASEAFRHIRVAGVDFPFEPLEPHGSARQRDLSGDELRVLLPEVAWSEGWPDGLRCVRAAYMDLGRHRLGHVWFQGDGAAPPGPSCQLNVCVPGDGVRTTIHPSDGDAVRSETTVLDRPALWVARPREHRVIWTFAGNQYGLACLQLAPERVRQLAEHLQHHLAMRR